MTIYTYIYAYIHIHEYIHGYYIDIYFLDLSADGARPVKLR